MMFTYIGHDRWRLTRPLETLNEAHTKCLGVHHVADRLVVRGEVPGGEDAWFLVHFMGKNFILLYNGEKALRVVYEKHADYPGDEVMFADVESKVELTFKDHEVLRKACSDFTKEDQ